MNYGIQINREPQAKFVREIDFNIDMESISEVMERLRRIRLELSHDELEKSTFTVEGDEYNGGNVVLMVRRLETPAEVAERVARQEAFNERNRESRRQQFLKMKQEFEGS